MTAPLPLPSFFKKYLSAIHAGFALTVLLAPSAPAANIYWDVNGNTSGTGGTGIWDNGTTANWSASNLGGTPITWSNAGLNQAVFGGTPGTVTVSGTVVTGLTGGNAALTLGTTTAGTYTVTGGAITMGLSASDTNSALNAVAVNSTNVAPVAISTPITLQVSNRTGNVDYQFKNSSAASLTFGNISLQDLSGGTSTGVKFYNFDQLDAAGNITINGNLGGPVALATTGLAFGNKGGLGTAKYYVNGNNSALSTGASVAVVQGSVYVGHANALGGSGVTTTLGSGANTASVLTNGAVTVASQFKSGSSVGSAGGQVTVGGATADDSAFSGGFSLTNGGMNFTAVAGGRVVFSGTIDGNNNTTGTLTKTGAGIVVLTGANTYNGGTVVTAGTLLLNNTSGSGSGQSGSFGTTPITVGVNGTLGGTGGGIGRNTGLTTATGASSTFSPGDMTKEGVSSIGNLRLTGGINAASGATFNYDISGASIDQITLGSGPLTLGGHITFNFLKLDTLLTETPYSLFTGSGTWSGTPTFTFSAPVGYQLDSNYGSGNGYIWNPSGHSLTVQFAVIPEPTALAFLLGTFGVLFLFRRRSPRI